jgi:hypothetical protein
MMLNRTVSEGVRGERPLTLRPTLVGDPSSDSRGLHTSSRRYLSYAGPDGPTNS